MEAGAVDFVAKCSINKRLDQKTFIDEVANKIRIAKKSRVKINKASAQNKNGNVNNISKINESIIHNHYPEMVYDTKKGKYYNSKTKVYYDFK